LLPKDIEKKKWEKFPKQKEGLEKKNKNKEN